MNLDEDEPPSLVDLDGKNEEPTLTGTPAVKVPITIVTGYLGAGKTTLMNYVLNQNHGKKIAVILNEFGDSIDIEKSLTINKGGEQVEEWLEVGNGCICCSVKDTGVNAIESLMEKKGAFDYILLETTGLADPGNLVPLFWVDEGLGSTIYLDGIVTLIDARNILKSVDEPVPETIPLPQDPEEREKEEKGHKHEGPELTTAHLQISHADVIVLNKADLVSEEELKAVRSRIESINGLAKIHVTTHGAVPQLEGVLLDLHAYDSVSVGDVAGKGHSHLDPTITTISFSIPPLSPNQLKLLDKWLQSILWDKTLPTVEDTVDADSGFEIHRLKARLPLTDGTVKIVQGVREIFDILDPRVDEEREDSGSEQGKIVIIGRRLLAINFKGSFSAMMASA